MRVFCKLIKGERGLGKSSIIISNCFPVVSGFCKSLINVSSSFAGFRVQFGSAADWEPVSG